MILCYVSCRGDVWYDDDVRHVCLMVVEMVFYENATRARDLLCLFSSFVGLNARARRRRNERRCAMSLPSCRLEIQPDLPIGSFGTNRPFSAGGQRARSLGDARARTDTATRARFRFRSTSRSRSAPPRAFQARLRPARAAPRRILPRRELILRDDSTAFARNPRDLPART